VLKLGIFTKKLIPSKKLPPDEQLSSRAENHRSLANGDSQSRDLALALLGDEIFISERTDRPATTINTRSLDCTESFAARTIPFRSG